MGCYTCSTKKETLFFVESFPCNCGDTVEIHYHKCEVCGSVWRECDGEVLDETDVIRCNDLLEVMNDEGIMEEQIDLIKDSLSTTSSMEDCIHRCLNCNGMATETEKGIYKCNDPVCCFEWEVVGSEW